MTAKEVFDNLSEEEKEKLVSSFKGAIDAILTDKKQKFLEYQNQLSELTKNIADSWAIEREMSYSEEKTRLSTQRHLNEFRLAELKESIIFDENEISLLENGGMVVSITDKKGFEHNSILDYRLISTNFIGFNEDNILLENKPIYFPKINEEIYKRNRYVFDSIRLQKDTYLVSLNRHIEEVNKLDKNQYVILTLDQLVLMNDYYFTKEKAKAKDYAKKQNEAQDERYKKLPEEKRRHYLFTLNSYNQLPSAVKKKVTKEDWELLDLEQREELYIPVKRYGAKRIVREVELDTMPRSFHKMYERFIEPTAYTKDKNGNRDDDRGQFGDPRVFEYWRAFVKMLEYKIKDIQIQRQDLSETYQQAIETSFGESNTDLVLKDKYGILVKRQNGDKIKLIEIEQIRSAWESVSNVFGNLKPNADKYNLKISHSGKRLIFASKAIGTYVPSMGAIAVSDKYGDVQFISTMAHEVAHFIDNFIGELSGKRYSSDDYEGTAGELAFAFRDNMNKTQEQSDYINSTKECFARALQQYHTWKTYGDDGVVQHSYIELDRTTPMFNADTFCPKEKFLNKVAPLIEKFFEENKDVFKTTFDIDGSSEVEPIGEEASIEDTINGLKALLEIADESEKEELENLI